MGTINKKFFWKNDGFRTLYESTVSTEIIKTLKDWKDNYNDDNYVLIGGLALSYHIKPRATNDVDLLFLSYIDAPFFVNGFRKNRKHAFLHKETNVEVEVLNMNFLNIKESIFDIIFNNAIISSDGIRVSSPKDLIYLKLERYYDRDIGDIGELISYCKENKIDLNYDDYDLSENQILNLKKSLNNNSGNIQNSHMLECISLFSDKKKNIKKISGEDYIYEIYVMNEEYSDVPCFHFGKNVGSRVMKYDDFSYMIEIPEGINEDLNVIFSSTDYKSFNSKEDEHTELKNWIKDNLGLLKSGWNSMNPDRII